MLEADTRVWMLNGVLNAPIDPAERGLAYGDGVFETMRYCRGSIPFLNLHFSRLLDGCQRLAIPLCVATLRLQLAQLTPLITQPEAVVKLVVTRGVGGRGYIPPTAPSASYLWQVLPMPQQGSESEGVTLEVSSVLLGCQPLLAGMKHLNRLEYVMAAQQLGDGIPLLLDTEGKVVEALSQNIFFSIAGELITPSLDNAGVAGVLRQSIKSGALAEYLPQSFPLLQERTITAAQLALADEVFIGNSVRGFWPVTAIKGLLPETAQHPAFTRGPLCRELQSAYVTFCNSEIKAGSSV